MVMVAVFAFVDGKAGSVVVVLGDFGGQLGFFAGVVDDFMAIAYPATLRLVNLIRVQVFVSIGHIFLL